MKIKTRLFCLAYTVLIFGAMFANTFIVDELRGFFGDTISQRKYFGIVEQYEEWGMRHYIYFWFSFCLFALSIISAIVHIYKLENEEQK